MPVNPYFDNFTNGPEQTLMSDLIVESIKVYGYNMYYIPRSAGNKSDILNSDDMSSFNSAYLIEMYIKSVEGFEGDGSFLSKFGLEVRDRVTLSCARATFNTIVGTPTTLSRPKEGDLIYFTMTKKLFEIKYVDNRSIFYPLGALPLYDIQCEVFEYNNEVFNTGINAIDGIELTHSIDSVPYTANNVVDPLFDEEEMDVNFDNNDFEIEFRPLLDITITDPFSTSGGGL